ncbi:substrate-binding periplasmic protein [Pseudomonadota bacterium]
MLRFKGMAFAALLACVCAPSGQVWAAEKPTYLLNTSTGAPYATEEKSGFLDLVVAEAFRRIGEKGEVPVYSASKRALINANEGVDHGVAMRVKSLDQKFPNLVRVPERIIENDFVASSRNMNFATSSWASLKPYTVAHIHGWVIFENNLVEGQAKTTVKDAAQMFTMLGKERVDAVLYERWQGLQRAKDTGLAVTVHEPPLASVDMFMFMHKDHAHLVEPLAQALRDMKADGTYQKIFDQTLTPLTAGQ